MLSVVKFFIYVSLSVIEEVLAILPIKTGDYNDVRQKGFER
jgi:hypothetical protein